MEARESGLPELRQKGVLRRPPRGERRDLETHCSGESPLFREPNGLGCTAFAGGPPRSTPHRLVWAPTTIGTCTGVKGSSCNRSATHVPGAEDVRLRSASR